MVILYNYTNLESHTDLLPGNMLVLFTDLNIKQVKSSEFELEMTAMSHVVWKKNLSR